MKNGDLEAELYCKIINKHQQLNFKFCHKNTKSQDHMVKR